MNLIPMSRVLAHWAGIQPDRVAVVIDGESVSFAELDALTNQLARAYADLGVGQDDFVTIALPNSIEFVAASFATWKLGATPQPISAALPKAERDAIITLARPSLVVGPEDIEDGVPSLPAGFSDYRSYPAEALEERTASKIKAMTSGGSTGRPKLIVMPLPAVWDLDAKFLGFAQQSISGIPGPLYHNGPFMWMFISLCMGCSIVLSRRFDAEQTLTQIEQHRITNLYQVPTMMQRIWSLPEEIRSSYDVSSLKVLWHMAAPCPAWLKEAFIEWLGPDVVWELYGGTEGQGSTIISGTEWLTHPGSVGRPSNCEMKIVADDGSTLPAGEVGEVYMRLPAEQGPSYEYVGAEASAIDEGWETIGDMGYLDEEGYLYLADRRTDLILSGGANIYPAEVEAAIDAYPGVRSSAVIGLPHKDLGHAVHAIVDVPGERIEEGQLLSFLADQLVRYKHPRSFEFVSEPLRDEAGKVRRKALKEARLSQER